MTDSSNQIYVFRVKRIPTFYPIQPFHSALLPFPTACASDFTSQITYLLLYPHQRRPRLYIIYSLILTPTRSTHDPILTRILRSRFTMLSELRDILDLQRRRLEKIGKEQNRRRCEAKIELVRSTTLSTVTYRSAEYLPKKWVRAKLQYMRSADSNVAPI